jgi:hypothetical protein
LTLRIFVSVGAVCVASLLVGAATPAAQTRPLTVVMVRHPESSSEPPTFPLTPVGRQRAELLVQTFRDLKFTHVFASHTTRARQTAEPVAAFQKLQIVQLPEPGSLLGGQPVTDATSRQAAIAPLADAVLRVPPGSVVLLAANSDNIYGILNRLGVPLDPKCASGSMCVPCLTNACFPNAEFDRLWYLVIEPGSPKPIVMIESRYGVGWSPAKQ